MIIKFIKHDSTSSQTRVTICLNNCVKANIILKPFQYQTSRGGFDTIVISATYSHKLVQFQTKNHQLRMCEFEHCFH